MLLCKYGEVYSGLRFCPCSCRSPAPVPVCPTATRPLDTLFTTSQMFPVAPNRCCSPSPSSFHPRSTPRAVAREAGGGWCAVRRRRGTAHGWASPYGRAVSILKKEKPRVAVSEMAGGEGWQRWYPLVLSLSFSSGGGDGLAAIPSSPSLFPPREQLLAAVVGGAAVVSPSSSLWSCYHLTTPRAGARGSGGGRSGGAAIVVNSEVTIQDVCC